MNNNYSLCNLLYEVVPPPRPAPIELNGDFIRNRQKWIEEILERKAREDKPREDKPQLEAILLENKRLKERIALYEPGISSEDDDPINY